MFRKMRKLIAGILIGAGVGILLILFLPVNVWFIIIGLGLIVVGINYLFKC